MAEKKSKTQIEMIFSTLRGKFRDILTDNNVFPVGVMNVEINIHNLKTACRENSKKKKLKEFAPIEFSYLENNLIPNFVLDFSYDEKKKTLNFKKESGMFKVDFSDGSFMVFAQKVVGLGRSAVIETYVVASRETLNKYFAYVNKQMKINSRPKVGLYKIDTVNTPNGLKLHYEPIKKKEFKKNNLVFHQNKKLVEDDIKMFFDNIDLYTRFDLPGSRRLLLVGEPGGGKTSAANQIAQEYADQMCVVQATSLQAVMMHTFNIAKADMPTLIILEDAEATIPWNNSDVLNYLDGIKQPKTKKGCYMILTTNFPKRIEPRVLKRPGRIDKIIKFGILDEVNSMLCVKHYFDGILFDSKKDKTEVVQEILKQTYEKVVYDKDEIGMTGAQIKNLSETTVSYAVSNGIQKITVDTLVAVKEQLNKDLKDVYDMADEESLTVEKIAPVGYGTSKSTTGNSEKLDWKTIMNPKTTDDNFNL